MNISILTRGLCPAFNEELSDSMYMYDCRVQLEEHFRHELSMKVWQPTTSVNNRLLRIRRGIHTCIKAS